MKKYKIFIACDTNKISEVKKIISQTNTKKLEIGYKFGGSKACVFANFRVFFVYFLTNKIV